MRGKGISDRTLVPAESIELKAEHVLVMEVDENKHFIYDDQPEDVREKIDASGEKFEETTIAPMLIGAAINAPCPCRGQLERLQRRWKTLRGKEKEGWISQKDFDSYDWTLLVTAQNGVNQQVAVVVRKCTCCGRIEFFCDDPTVLVTHFSHVYQGHLDAMNADYVVEDLETGEMQPADDLMKEMMGLGN